MAFDSSVSSARTFDSLADDIRTFVASKTHLEHKDSVAMAKIVEKGIRILEANIDKLNESHEDIRKILVDDMSTMTESHINSINDIGNTINKEHEQQREQIEKMENVRLLDVQIDSTQKEITDMLDYCEEVVEKANEWLLNMCKKEMYNKCTLKKLKL